MREPPYSKEPAFQPTNPYEQPIGRFVVQLVTTLGEISHCMGTAFIIADGIAVTAAHCLDAMIRTYGPTHDGPEGPEGDWHTVAIQHVTGGARIWVVDKFVATHEHFDLALLRLRGNPDWHHSVHPRISFRPPRVGERVVSFGYAGWARHKGEETIEVDDGGHTSVGEVLEVFPGGRDRVLAPYPCFHVNARFDDAQSGSPVFNEAGAICGVVSRSLPAVDAEDQHTSVVSMIYPISWLRPLVPWDAWTSTEPFTLFDFFHAGTQVDELDRLTRDGDDWVFDSAPRP